MKTCTKCGLTKPIDAFYIDKRHSDRRTARCGACIRAYVAQWRRDNGEAVRARQRASYRKNYAETTWPYRLQQNFGITVEDYERMLAEQGGVCAICRGPEVGKNRDGSLRRLAVDHDHRTGAVRGLLCANCNKAIGCFQDDPAVMRAAIDYVTRRR